MSSDHDVDTVEIPALAPTDLRTPDAASSGVRVDLGGLSHTGKVRPKNEDHFLVARFGRAMQTLLTNLPPGNVPEHFSQSAYGLVVADGVGGASAGEVASRAAISVLVELVLQTPYWIMRPDEQLVKEVQGRAARRFRAVGEALAARARADPSLFGMATTLTLAASLGAEMVVTHVGDSRAYLFRQGRLLRLTRDHTFAQALADCGAIRPEDVATHGLRHVLTNVIGAKGDEVNAELHHLRLADGDQVLLCTDGLTEMAPDAAVAEVLGRPGPAAAACDALVELALAGGGRDNVTVVLARYHIPDGPG
jgi:protein phosphatase